MGQILFIEGRPTKAYVQRVDQIFVGTQKEIDEYLDKSEGNFDGWIIPTEFTGEIIMQH